MIFECLNYSFKSLLSFFYISIHATTTCKQCIDVYQPGSVTVSQAAWQSSRQRDSHPGSMTVSQAAWQSARQRDSHVIFFHFHAETYLIPFRHIKRETRPSKELTDMKVSSDSGEIEVTVQHISTNLYNHHGIVYSFLIFFIIVFMSFYSFNHLYSFIDRQFL